jgi:hypothetical protein
MTEYLSEVICTLHAITCLSSAFYKKTYTAFFLLVGAVPRTEVPERLRGLMLINRPLR